MKTIVLALVLTTAFCQNCDYANLFRQYRNKEISYVDYVEQYRRCFVDSNTNGYQPSCSFIPPETQAVAKINNRGTLTTESGESIDFHVKGVVSFQQINSEQTRIYAVFTGLNVFYDDSDQFSLHVHQIGETNPSCSSTGGHFNPCNKDHSDDPKAENRHVGDVAKVTIDRNSDTLVIDVIDPQVKLSGPLSVLGRSVTVHAGASAARVGCATIAVTEWEEGQRHQDTLYDAENPTEFWSTD